MHTQVNRWFLIGSASCMTASAIVPSDTERRLFAFLMGVVLFVDWFTWRKRDVFHNDRYKTGDTWVLLACATSATLALAGAPLWFALAIALIYILGCARYWSRINKDTSLGRRVAAFFGKKPDEAKQFTNQVKNLLLFAGLGGGAALTTLAFAAWNWEWGGTSSSFEFSDTFNYIAPAAVTVFIAVYATNLPEDPDVNLYKYLRGLDADRQSAQVFISHHNEDSVIRLAEAIRAAIKSVYKLEDRDFLFSGHVKSRTPPGQPVPEDLAWHATNAKLFMYLYTPGSKDSDWQKWELGMRFGVWRSRNLMPVTGGGATPNCDEARLFGNIQWGHTETDEGVEELLLSLGSFLEKAPDAGPRNHAFKKVTEASSEVDHPA